MFSRIEAIDPNCKGSNAYMYVVYHIYLVKHCCIDYLSSKNRYSDFKFDHHLMLENALILKLIVVPLKVQLLLKV